MLDLLGFFPIMGVTGGNIMKNSRCTSFVMGLLDGLASPFDPMVQGKSRHTLTELHTKCLKRPVRRSFVDDWKKIGNDFAVAIGKLDGESSKK